MPTHKSTNVSASSSSNRKPAATAPAAARAAAPSPTPPVSPTPAALAPAAPAPPAPAPSPQPPPDPNAALAAFAQQAVAMIDTIAAGLGDDPTLAPKDKRRAVRFRKGGGPIAVAIGDLAQQQQLELPSLNVATMTSLLGRANAVAPLVNRLPALVALVNDIAFAAQSQAWAMALQYYAVLRRLARTDTKLAAALQPVTQFLAYRHPSTKPAVGAPTTKQVNAAKKAQKALATVAGGKLAGTNLLAPRKPAASASAAPTPEVPATSPAPAGNGASPPAASPATNGGTPPAAHS
jgi:hypothetical protein